ncbi:MAG: thrS [Firmicutes bacterium]|nr:thrS [Bacillota bacterium]
MTSFFWPDGTQEERETQKQTLLEIACTRSVDMPVLAATVDGQYRDLQTLVGHAKTVQFYDISSSVGNRVYGRSLTMLLVAAAEKIFPRCRVRVEHSLSDGLYGEMTLDLGKPSVADFKALEKEMRLLVSENAPIIRQLIPREQAIQLFETEGQAEKAAILCQLALEKVTSYKIGGVSGYYYGHLVPYAGYLDVFEIKPYAAGFVLRYPKTIKPKVIGPWKEQAKLYQVYDEAERWGDILDCAYVSDLNQHMAAGRGADIIRVAEALHEKKLAETADLIAKGADRYRVILIAGPSSSGKTTLAQRLSVQLRVSGLKPRAISIDDYFVNRDKTPVDAAGNYDFEALEAVDLELFNTQLAALLDGEEVELPRFNFLTGCREASGQLLRLTEDQPIIIEGIHALNDRLTEAIPAYNKFHIYVCPLTQISLDFHNRVPSSEARLIRRIVRDASFRGYDAAKTLRLWPNVRRGEERNIFPYQDNADVMFNSALIYELAVMKKKAEQALKAVLPHQDEYAEAIRLLGFLQYFVSLENEGSIPNNSILREFIGGSCFTC